MNNSFRIEIDWLEGSDGAAPERASFAQIAINVEQTALTELEDLFARTTRNGLRGPAYDLAMWLTANWWRLRWEPEAQSIDWQLSHVMAAIGQGVAWPNITFASDGAHVLIQVARTNRTPGAPVRYLRAAYRLIDVKSFEVGIDEFIERVLTRLSSLDIADTDLNALWNRLCAERNDLEIVARRRLEALLGFDQDEAPANLLEDLRQVEGEAGQNAIDEIAAAAKTAAVSTVREMLEVTRNAGCAIEVPDVAAICANVRQVTHEFELPWQRAKKAASIARERWRLNTGPISNHRLSEIFSVPEDILNPAHILQPKIAAGLRGDDDADRLKIIIRAKVQTGRRFELVRLAADHIAAASTDRLLPVTAAKTDRQKFQRAFAQEFLAPADELSDQLSGTDFGDDAIDDIAETYGVSSFVVAHALENRGLR